MYKGMKVSVGIVAYNEESAIAKVVKDFLSQRAVDEVVVVDNNSKDRTDILAKYAGARVLSEKRQGYGFACRTALKSCKGDLVFLTEGDCTFSAKDLLGLLEYIDDYDIVVGTRTKKEFIAKGAKMNQFLYYGNKFIAWLINIRFKTKLTDVGCTYRVVKKDSLNKILRAIKDGSGKWSYFSPDMIVTALKNGLKIKEVPVYYGSRIGESKITANFWKSFKLGLKMIQVVLS